MKFNADGSIPTTVSVENGFYTELGRDNCCARKHDEVTKCR